MAVAIRQWPLFPTRCRLSDLSVTPPRRPQVLRGPRGSAIPRCAVSRKARYKELGEHLPSPPKPRRYGTEPRDSQWLDRPRQHRAGRSGPGRGASCPGCRREGQPMTSHSWPRSSVTMSPGRRWWGKTLSGFWDTCRPLFSGLVPRPASGVDDSDHVPPQRGLPRAGTGGNRTVIFAPQEHQSATSAGLTSGSSSRGGTVDAPSEIHRGRRRG
jgi:hypothetical protein